MACLQVSAVLLVLVVLTYCQSDVRKPPDITFPITTTDLYYSENTNVVVQCTADGVPQPTYQWLLNETPITPTSRTTFDSTLGTLKISNFTTREEGTFICVASNVFNNGGGGQITAASWSARVRLWQSRIPKFDEPMNITKSVIEFDYVMLTCGNNINVVGAVVIYNWYLFDRTGINLDGGRLFIDQRGNLHFTYVLGRDAGIGFYCGISTDDEKVIRLGTRNDIQVSTRSPLAVKPQIQYTNSGIKGLLFNSVKLECVFSCYDPSQSTIPVVQWLDDAGKPIVYSQKYMSSNNGRVLTITNLQEEDEKQYTCTTKNSAGEASSTVFLNVTSGPIFVDGAPNDQTVPEGTDVEFNCDARSASGERPPNPPVWRINGVLYGSSQDPNKFQLSPDRKVLIIKNVKKATDIMCVQCEVSNDIDTILANACLNVILPITITREPKLVQEIRFGNSVDMTVTASTDPSMTLSYRWEFSNKSYVGSERPPNMFYNPNTMLAYINTSTLSESQYVAIGGVYRRVIYHIYETKNVDIDVILADRQAATAAVAIYPWIIAIIVIAVFIIIVLCILFIVCFICRKKQEGDYNVDKKETGAGLDPEKELKDKDFNAFSRPDYGEYYNYPDTKPAGGDPEFEDTIIGDDESLGEYGKEDITHFNEDGSFIGIYQSKKPPPPQPSESTI